MTVDIQYGFINILLIAIIIILRYDIFVILFINDNVLRL